MLASEGGRARSDQAIPGDAKPREAAGTRNKLGRGGFAAQGRRAKAGTKKALFLPLIAGEANWERMMNFREILASLRQFLPVILLVVAVIVGGVVAIFFLPGRTAAVIIGVIAAAILTYYLVRSVQRSTRIALLWLAIGVSADAAYAKINDQAPVTVASSLVKLAESIIKLGDIVIRSLGVPLVADSRVRTASVAPEFVWAFILAIVVFLAFSLMRDEE
jgi:hypothetical protein